MRPRRNRGHDKLSFEGVDFAVRAVREANSQRDPIESGVDRLDKRHLVSALFLHPRLTPLAEQLLQHLRGMTALRKERPLLAQSGRLSKCRRQFIGNLTFCNRGRLGHEGGRRMQVACDPMAGRDSPGGPARPAGRRPTRGDSADGDGSPAADWVGEYSCLGE